jgi:hypothetical protein
VLDDIASFTVENQDFGTMPDVSDIRNKTIEEKERMA